MIRALLFDKDGTLFDFRKSWQGPFLKMVRGVAGGDDALFAELCAYLQISPEGHIAAGSPLVHAAGPQMEEIIRDGFPQVSHEQIQRAAHAAFAGAMPVPVMELAPFLKALADEGYAMAIVTNDGETSARGQMAHFGVERYFRAVVGFDSGFGAKPDPGMVTAALEKLDRKASDAVMIGDSIADMKAGRAAGCTCVAVLTGTRSREELAPHADVVLEDISELPGWLAQVQ
ncbi:HAD family hydrolase [Paracoccaceae bacterium GXU_MW_L88]